MMNRPSNQPINDYLDRMNPTERTAFLASLSDEARAELELQQSIDDSLHRVFGRRLDDLETRIAKSIETIPDATANQNFFWRVRRGLAIAALLAFAAGGIWYSWTLVRPTPLEDVYAPQPWRSFSMVYDHMRRNGFQPDWVCRSERQFEAAFSRRFRQPLLLAALPAGVSAGGISYSHTLSESTVTVLGNVDNEPILVFVDRLSADQLPPPPVPEGLNLFRREIDDLVLYELTPHDHPAVLPYFYNPSKALLP